MAMRGFAADGHAFIGKAAAAGAARGGLRDPPADGILPYVQVENSRRSLAVSGPISSATRPGT